jgi:hypothetical protein
MPRLNLDPAGSPVFKLAIDVSAGCFELDAFGVGLSFVDVRDALSLEVIAENDPLYELEERLFAIRESIESICHLGRRGGVEGGGRV